MCFFLISVWRVSEGAAGRRPSLGCASAPKVGGYHTINLKAAMWIFTAVKTSVSGSLYMITEITVHCVVAMNGLLTLHYRIFSRQAMQQHMQLAVTQIIGR
jgi:hypothetical protein